MLKESHFVIEKWDGLESFLQQNNAFGIQTNVRAIHRMKSSLKSSLASIEHRLHFERNKNGWPAEKKKSCLPKKNLNILRNNVALNFRHFTWPGADSIKHFSFYHILSWVASSLRWIGMKFYKTSPCFSGACDESEDSFRERRKLFKISCFFPRKFFRGIKCLSA